MASFFSQASPPPCKSPSQTPPPKRKRDQLLTPGGKDIIFFLDSSLWSQFTNKDNITRTELQSKETLGTQGQQKSRTGDGI